MITSSVQSKKGRGSNLLEVTQRKRGRLATQPPTPHPHSLAQAWALSLHKLQPLPEDNFTSHLVTCASAISSLLIKNDVHFFPPNTCWCNLTITWFISTALK